MKNINLSYIVTTKNKLEYLEISIKDLIDNKKDDEEILIADCLSSDGTQEFLKKLTEDGKIDYYVSELDVGESHALNKLMLAANGSLIQIITDDDVYHYDSIQICKNYMLKNQEIDALGTNGGLKNQYENSAVKSLIYTDNYKNWQTNKRPFSFCCLGLMMRRSSIPVLGLWNTNFRRSDAEFTFRITSGLVNLAWFTSPTYVNISNPKSVSLVYSKKILNETKRLDKFYLDKNPDPFFVGKFKILINKLKSLKINKTVGVLGDFNVYKTKLRHISKTWLEEQNINPGVFLYKK